MSNTAHCRCSLERVLLQFFDIPALSDEEYLVAVIRDRNGLRNEGGVQRVHTTAFRREDVEGKKGKTVSLLRSGYTHPGEIARHASALTRQNEWLDDPVIAKAEAAKLRAIASKHYPKCLCVYADPISQELAEKERIGVGESCGHASMKKHCDFQGKNDPSAWSDLLSDMAEVFEPAIHVRSGAPAAP